MQQKIDLVFKLDIVQLSETQKVKWAFQYLHLVHGFFTSEEPDVM